MTPHNRREILKGVGGLAFVCSLAGCGGGTGSDGTTTAGGSTATTASSTTATDTTAEPTSASPGTTDAPETTAETSTPGGDEAMVRVAHLSPDAPNVDVLVNGQPALTNVPFGTVSDYLSVPPDSYQVTIQAAGDPSTVVYDETVDLAAGAYTAAALGELESGAEHGFGVELFDDDTTPPADDTARVRVLHASPDAPAVDLTVADSGDVLVDGLAFGDTATTTIPPGDYTLQVRGDTESNDGDVVDEFDVTVRGGTAYTAIALGYFTPDGEPTDATFDLKVVEDS